MSLINILDENQRYKGFKHNPFNVKQRDSHGYSYVYMREQYKALGQDMGFDNTEKLDMYQVMNGLKMTYRLKE